MCRENKRGALNAWAQISLIIRHIAESEGCAAAAAAAAAAQSEILSQHAESIILLTLLFCNLILLMFILVIALRWKKWQTRPRDLCSHTHAHEAKQPRGIESLIL
jgi:hypothetical protein